MANTFYHDACNVDSKMTPFPVPIKPKQIDEGLVFHDSLDKSNGELKMPHSIMNENVAINYRTIYNGYPAYSTQHDFTEYSDYERCMVNDSFYNQYMEDKKNPSYKNIIKYYGSNQFDPYGLARYRMQDFIYLKYYNQIPNNYMITLRRYTKPCSDRMFGLDMDAATSNAMNGLESSYFALATAVTYMGEKTGNKLSEILKFDYGANWDEKEGQTEAIQNPDGGLSAQLRERGRTRVPTEMMQGTLNSQELLSTTGMRQMLKFSAAVQGKGSSVNDAMAASNAYEGNAFAQRYGENFYGDINVVNKVKVRSRGLTFSNNFTLTFEYSLKSLKCVNPRVAMMDILSNFLILTGNYGTFWGGATIFYGQRNIAPQYGDPNLLRQGKYKEYMNSVVGDVKNGFLKITEMGNGISNPWDIFKGLFTGIKNIGSGFIQGLIGNFLGGNIGVAGQSVVAPALLSGAPSGYWHVTVGNPLDPIAMMGNMAVTNTTVEFSDYLGYDDFPTEIKFTVSLEHCMPRENSMIENMFNAGKGRIYAFTDENILSAYRTIDAVSWAQRGNPEDNNISPDAYTIELRSIVKTMGGNQNG